MTATDPLRAFANWQVRLSRTIIFTFVSATEALQASAMKLRETIYAQVSVGQIDAHIVGLEVSTSVKCSALENSRTLMGSYEEIEKAFSSLVSELRASRRMWLKPKILIHLLPEFDGGYTDAELRAFREIGESAGCTESWVLADHDIASDEQLEMLFNGPMGMSLIPRKEEL